MTNQRGAVLKPGKEKAIRNHHHWIFSGAIETLPSFKDGDFLPVYTSNGQHLGTGYFNRKSGIIGRMVSFDQTPPLEAIKIRLEEAFLLRERLFNPSVTNAYRLVNAEGDGIPGLIIDRYGDCLVIQVSTKGMDNLKSWIVDYCIQKLAPKMIYEKSMLPARKEEGLQDQQGLLWGENLEEVTVLENGLSFVISFEKSQKTGFFLDHRAMRNWVKEHSRDKRVLNAFSYTGGFSVYALAGGAERVDSVDISEEAIERARQHVSLNGFDPSSQGFFCEDVFHFLREKELNYDLVILDPPAFAKRQKDVIAACRGYKDINRIAMSKMPPRSLLLTCSCSHHVDEVLFQKVIFQAASEAKRFVRILGRHRLAEDHPINLFHPEGEYLKSLILYIN